MLNNFGEADPNPRRAHSRWPPFGRPQGKGARHSHVILMTSTLPHPMVGDPISPKHHECVPRTYSGTFSAIDDFVKQLCGADVHLAEKAETVENEARG